MNSLTPQLLGDQCKCVDVFQMCCLCRVGLTGGSLDYWVVFLVVVWILGVRFWWLFGFLGCVSGGSLDSSNDAWSQDAFIANEFIDSRINVFVELG